VEALSDFPVCNVMTLQGVEDMTCLALVVKTLNIISGQIGLFTL
jgi:hypothetical protein